jgi:hypothetical protein
MNKEKCRFIAPRVREDMVSRPILIINFTHPGLLVPDRQRI